MKEEHNSKREQLKNLSQAEAHIEEKKKQKSHEERAAADARSMQPNTLSRQSGSALHGQMFLTCYVARDIVMTNIPRNIII